MGVALQRNVEMHRVDGKELEMSLELSDFFTKLFAQHFVAWKILCEEIPHNLPIILAR
jgi:hypothetical protein